MEFNSEQLNHIFPFHVIINESLEIVSFGNGLKKICPGIEERKKLGDFFELKAPLVPLTYEDILQKEKKLFLFSIKGKELQLKGQVLCFNDSLLFILSPVVTDSVMLKKIGLTLKDFAIYDSIADTLFLLNAQKMALNESKQFYSRLLETNKKLEAANKEVTEMNSHLEQKVIERTAEIQNTLSELKATQAQLIQSEKMASLGELTAGIAHEIQNPLNFVNNFSDLNRELIGELKAESLKPKAERDDELLDKILKDLEDNEQRINHHGKRADAIVKGMLMHSRASSGKKEPTDINVLCDEYLRLAYHGLRAKDKSFNANFETDCDPSVGKINVVPQDIGRVLLNLINNAFYAVSEKAKRNIPGYEPTVTVATKKLGESGKVEVKVKDNGIGVPESIKDKIFQPFFTTKPAGQGTGLGLSLSYDIVKAQGGDIRLEAREREGSEFIIQLPNR